MLLLPLYLYRSIPHPILKIYRKTVEVFVLSAFADYNPLKSFFIRHSLLPLQEITKNPKRVEDYI